MKIRVKSVLSIILFSLLNLFMITETTGQMRRDYSHQIRDYLVHKGEIREGIRYSIYAFELLTADTIYNGSCGIYRIGTFTDHGLTYLCIVDENNVFFLDFEDLANTMKSVLSFIDKPKYKFTEKEKIVYLRKIIDISIMNKNRIPW